MFRFESPEYLYLLLLIPIFIGAYILYRIKARRNIKAAGNFGTIMSLMPELSTRRTMNKAIIFMVATMLLILAAARPQSGSKLSQSTHEGVEIVFTLDVSNSMLADDFKPNRLERTKYSITRILDKLPNDLVGVVIFAGDAYTQLPLTADHSAALNFIDDISPDMVSKQGTDLARAINHASNSFSTGSEDSRVIVLISDGESHEGDALAAAKAASEKGITLYTIGIGTPEGSPININGEFIKDENGDMVVSKLDEQTLQKIAVTSGGAYIRAANHSLGLEEIVSEIQKQQSKELSVMSFEEYDEQYEYFLWGAVVLLVLELLILDRKNRIFGSLNIFK
ncbi:MAG: VWA domain-containing protein [Rikenellaceae bacterium]